MVLSYVFVWSSGSCNQTAEQAQEREEAIENYNAKDRAIRAEITARLGSAERGSVYGVLGGKNGTRNRLKLEEYMICKR